ncbi:MAG: DUF6458 family protein [Geodermatophilaceae bacterium]
MALGTSIFLIALGGVLAFALDRDVISVVNVHIVGYILMAVGILGLIMSLVINSQRSRTQHTVVDDRRPIIDNRRPIVDDRRLPPDPPVRY